MNNKDNINEIISIIAHELRSPLTAVKGYLTAINDGVIEPDIQNKYINISLEETNRAIAMLESLMSLAKFDLGAVNLNITEFDINELIRRVIIEKLNFIESKNISVQIEFEFERLLVKADKNLIRQAISNLADNAIKYSNDSGKICFKTRTVNSKVEISVSDNGIGISDEMLLHIWERFYQKDRYEQAFYKGHGLGLAIVKEIISAHKSDITVESEIGKGTSFTFTLDIYT